MGNIACGRQSLVLVPYRFLHAEYVIDEGGLSDTCLRRIDIRQSNIQFNSISGKDHGNSPDLHIGYGS